MIFQNFNSPPKHSFVCNADSSLCSPADKLFPAQQNEKFCSFYFFFKYLWSALCKDISYSNLCRNSSRNGFSFEKWNSFILTTLLHLLVKFCWNNRTNLSLLVAQSLRIWWKRKWILRHLWHLWFLLWLACVSDQCHTKRKARLWCNRKHDGPCATYTDEVWRFWKFFFSTMPTRQTFIQLLPYSQ